MNTTTNKASPLPAQKLDDFSQDDNSRPLLQQPRLWLWIILAAALAFTVITPMALDEDTTMWMSGGLFMIGCLSGTRIVDLSLQAQAKRDAEYDQYLASIDLVVLRAVATSPEYDDHSKAAVIKHLSARQPGWSLQ